MYLIYMYLIYTSTISDCTWTLAEKIHIYIYSNNRQIKYAKSL